MAYGIIKDNPRSLFDYEEEVPSWDFFYKGKQIPLLGMLYDRPAVYEDGYKTEMPNLYLARKQTQPPNGGDCWASVEYTNRDVLAGKNKYQSYDGNPLSYHIPNEKEMMWLQATEIDVFITQKDLAAGTLEKWDD